MTERESKSARLSFQKGVHGGAYVLDQNTHYAIANVSGSGEFSGSSEAIDLLRKIAGDKPLPDFIREQAGYKPKGQ